MRSAGGKTDHVIIRRMKCPECGRLHNVLPSNLAKYKHYTTTTIENVLDGITDEKSPEIQDGPSYLTMRLWLKWFEMNLSRIEGYLHSIALRFTEQDTDGSLLLMNWRELGEGWLDAILRFIYNSGGFLPAYHSLKSL